MMGMNFVNPFMPLLVQQVGNFNNREAAFWGGIVTGATGIAMFFSAPLWGIVADRSGRKPMLLRSLFGSALVVMLLGIAPNIFYLVALRFALGVISGIKPAFYALVASTTPKDKIPFAMGLIAVATFGGTTIGPLFGGYLADSIGFRNTFFVATALIIASGLGVLFFSWEKFERPAQIQAFSLRRIWGLAISRQMLPILTVEFSLQASQQMLAPVAPLVIRELDPARQGVATETGVAFGLTGAIAAIAALVTGRLGGRISLKKMLVFACLIGGILSLPPIWAVSVAQFVILFALSGIPKGVLMTSSTALVSLSVSSSQQGMGYGMAHSARALGIGLGPLLGGSLGRLLGLKPVFGVAAGLFALAGAIVAWRLTEQTPKKS